MPVGETCASIVTAFGLFREGLFREGLFREGPRERFKERKWMVPVVSVVGRSKSGKTTLVEKLIKELNSRGYKVGAIKHDAHQFDIDVPGKDSWRHTQAGANPVVISSPDKLAMIKRVQQEISLDEIVERYIDGVDIVLTEGYKRQDKLKIEVLTTGKEMICSPSELIAVAGEDAVNIGDVPFFDRNDAKGITLFLEKNFLKG